MKWRRRNNGGHSVRMKEDVGVGGLGEGLMNEHRTVIFGELLPHNKIQQHFQAG